MGFGKPCCRRRSLAVASETPVGMTVRSDGLTGVFLGVLLVHLLHVQRQVVQERLRLVFAIVLVIGLARRAPPVGCACWPARHAGPGNWPRTTAGSHRSPQWGARVRRRPATLRTSGLTCPPTPAMHGHLGHAVAIQADRQVVGQLGRAGAPGAGIHQGQMFGVSRHEGLQPDNRAEVSRPGLAPWPGLARQTSYGQSVRACLNCGHEHF